MRHADLLNGVKLNAAHPDTFTIPSVERRNNLTIGDTVKIGLTTHEKDAPSAERFWVEVIDILPNGDYVARVDNELLFVDVQYNDTIQFGPENVLATHG